MSARNVETIYKLSPLQEGMLFHSVADPESDVYVVQFSAKIRGRLDVQALRASWRRLIERHGMLRTSFHWKEVSKPVQIVHRDVELPWNECDWRGEPATRVEQFLEEDLRRGFALERAPLIRPTLIRLEDELHQFVVTQHHLVLDGWSLHVMLREVFAGYRGAAAFPPARAFGDYLGWLRKQNLDEARRFWRELLADLDAPTPVPLECGSSAGAFESGGVAAAVQTWELGPDLTKEIQQFVRARELTVNTLVQGAWALMLGRLTGEDDVVYGSVVAGRPPEIAGIDSMVGMFINTLPVRVKVASDSTAIEWLRELQSTLAALRRFEFSPLVDVQSCSGVPRGTPLFNAVVAFENYPMESSLANAVPGLEIFDTRIAEQSNYPITLSVIPGESLRFKLVYDTGRLDRDAVRRILQSIEQLLREIVARPEHRLDELSIIDDAERRRVLHEWNATDRRYDGASCIHRLFEEQAARTPDRPAVFFQQQQIDFAELNARANRLAHHLRDLGVGPESIAGVCLDRSIDAVMALLAILKCGGAYLPLDPAYPRERLDFMCEDAQLELVLTESAHVEKVPAQAKRVLLDRDWPAIAREPAENLQAGVSGDNAAYVIYTSGSTGRPKGVVGLHAGAVNRFRWMWERYPFEAGEVHAQKTSLNFLDSLWEIFGPLLQGVPIAIVDNDTVKDADRFIATLDATAVTRLVLVPSLLRVLLESNRDPLLPKLKMCVTSGEELPAALARRFVERMPHCLLLNLYGSSEISADATYEEVRADGEAIPIGRPLANMRAYVLDRTMQPVPAGVPGELFIGGIGLARGYLRRPELTEQRFVADPYSSDSESRLFRTGDIARWREDGRLDYHGRSDHQVKIRGFRVELGEIESILLRHPNVKQCVTIVRDEHGDRRLVAYVIPREGELSASELRAHVAAALPDFMVPSAFVVLDALPLTPSGKIDRRSLPAPERPAGLQYVAPRTETETRVAEIFAAVLKVPRVGAEDDFFEAGGHSLMATQVISRVRDRFKVDLPVGLLFQAPTVAAFAKFLECGGKAVAFERGANAAALQRPLPFAQQRLWFLDQMLPGSPMYNVPIALRVSGLLDAGVLQRALSEIVRRHEVLRTRLVAVDGRPTAALAGAAPVPLEIAETTEDQLETLAREEVLRTFDLARDTLLRAKLLRLASDDHLLVVTMHHIATDGWSIGILIRELSSLYDSFSRNEPSSLPELTFQYADYARWQQDWLRSERVSEQLAFWKRQLEGMPPLLELPYDRPRPLLQSFNGAIENFSIVPALIEPLLELSHRRKATPFMTLLAALQTLLHRYSRQDRLTVGTPIAGRTRTELEPLIGFFINTLVLPADFSADPAFLEHLDRVRDVALEAYAHQDLPFDKLVDELRPERDLGRHPLFQVMFILQNETETAVAQPRDLRFEPLQIDPGVAKFDLLVQIVPQEGAWLGSIEYCTDLFDRSTIQRMIAHFQTLLASIAAEPHRRISELRILPESERRTVVFDWNATERDYGEPQLLHRLIEEQVERTPGAIAVTFGNDALTYRELDTRANQLARSLQSEGVGRNVLVAVSMERSLDLVVSLLAVLKAGGAYVPIDPGYPPERIRFMIEDCRAKVVLTQIDANDLASESTANRQPFGFAQGRPPTANDLAYVIYTSGSTGTPKGAMNHHRGIVNRLRWMQETFRLGANDVVAQKTPFSFDVSVWEFFWPLMTGARLAVAQPGVHRDSVALAEWMRRENVSVIHFVPPMLQTFLQHASMSDALRLVICSGEALPKSLADEFFAKSNGAELHNLYGPTEAAVDVTHWKCGPGQDRVPIGKPIANTKIFIVEKHDQPAPIGVPGELLIGGVQVGRGYLNRPELTAQKFANELYRTGDLARWLADGSVEFLGRLDDQIKLRGFRIELGEIESVLREHESVSDAVVVARDNSLIAYVVGSSEALRDHLRARLPESMLPAHIVTLDALPLTPNGKVDRRALPAPDENALERATERIAPRTQTETALASLWTELLRVEPGARDDFFALGGHSLLATRLVARVRETFGIELPLRTIFSAPRLEEMAAEIEHAEHREQIPIVAVDRAGELPLSFIQERLWFLDQFEPGSTSLNIPLVVRLRGALDEAMLERAFAELVNRHESLRTTFAVVDGTPRQVIQERGVDLVRVDLRSLGADLTRKEIEDEAARPFDLLRGPLVRARLLRITDDESILLVTVHHIVADGWSLAVLLRELDQLYTAVPLPPLALQYADFAHWQRTQVQGERLEQQLGYWKKTLAGAPPQIDLPLDFVRPAIQTYRGARVSRVIERELAEKLRAFSQSRGATLFMTLLAAFEVVLRRWSDQDDLVIGAPVASRPSREMEAVVGPFLNTVALRTDLTGNPTFTELVDRVREVALGAFQHQDVPFEKVLEAVSPERDLSRTPLFQVFLNMLNFPVTASRIGDLQLELLSAGDPQSKFDLTMYVAEPEQRLRFDLVYNADLFAANRIEEMLRQFTQVLHQIVESPEKKILDFSLVTGEARAVLPDPAQPLDDAWKAAVHDLFSMHARREPNRVAVIERNGSWTYGELEAISNRLANHLGENLDENTKPKIVAIYGHRGAALVAAILATLKSGAAFAMLDPAYPPQRNLENLRAISPSALIHLEDAGPLPPEIDRLDLVRVSVPSFHRIDTTAPADAPAVNAGPDDLACITFTSGSTGTPKAVAGLHRSLTHFTSWQCEHFGLGAGDRFSLLSGLAHDPLQRDIFTPLQIGAAICIPDPDRFGEPRYLAEWANASGVTVMHLTPAMIQLLIESSGNVSLPALRRAFIVGDVLTCDDVLRLEGIAPNLQPVNFYGSTETQRAVGYYEIGDEELRDPRRKAALPLGKGIPDVQLLVLNASGLLAGVGEVGEIHIRSPHLAGGYLNDPELTRTRFSDGRYRTGDLGRYRPDGNVEWFGRADRQVKVRGFRIELGEIEAALRRHPGVREAVVMPFGDDPTSRCLVAYVVGKSDELREFLAARLPEFMIPSAFVALDEIPLTPNRKIDRSALPRPVFAGERAAFVMPRDPVEIELARIFEEVLGRRPVGVRDDFFALGGHSLVAVRLLARIEQHFGRKLPLVTFFQRSTVEHLAAEIRRATQHRQRSPLVAIQPAGSARPLFCVHPVGGTVLCYRTLSAKLGSDQPLFALEAVGVDGDRPPIRSIEQMAREYVLAIRARQPRGPYQLGGWSFGGIVAFEMAQQLRAAGEESTVILLDTWTPGSLGDFEDAGDDATILRLLARALGDIGGRQFDLATETLRQQGGRDEQLAYVVDEAHRLQALPPDVGVAQLRPLFTVVEANLEARRNYRPSVFPGRLVLLKATEALIDAPDSDTLGWDKHAARGVDVHVVPGNHHTMLGDPHVDVLIGHLRAYLGEREAVGPAMPADPSFRL